MKMRWIGIWSVVLFFLAGCSSKLPMMDSGTQIPLTQIDAQLSKSFPVTRKASYGTLKVLGVSTQPGSGEKTLHLQAYFNLVSFEIPEGINGTVQYVATLRYDPAGRRVFVKDLKPVMLSFSNRSLEEYVSAAARRGIPATIAGVLKSVPLLQMPENFRATAIKEFSVSKDKIAIEFN